MVEGSRPDKYSLKGEYYIAMDRIEDILKKQFIKKKDYKDIKVELIELFYKNQRNNVPLEQVIGDDLERFISVIVEGYFSNFSWKKWLIDSIKSSILVFFVLTIINFIISGNLDVSIFTLVIMIIVLIEPVVNYLIVIKIRSEHGRNIAYFISILAIFIFIFLCSYFSYLI